MERCDNETGKENGYEWDIDLNKREPKKNIKIATWNVRGFREKEIELINDFEKYDVKLMGITETKLKESGIAKTLNDHVIIYSGIEQNKRAAGGVALIVHKDMEEYIEEWHPISERLLTVRLRISDCVYTIIITYGPNEDDTSEHKDRFWQRLTIATDSIIGTKIIIGDFNSRVGRDNIT